MRTFTQWEEAYAYVQNNVPWGNAAGSAKDERLSIRYASAELPITTYGSITWADRAGNPGDNFYYDERTRNSINA